MDSQRRRRTLLIGLATVAVVLLAATAGPLFETVPGGDRTPRFDRPAVEESTSDPLDAPSVPVSAILTAVFVLVAIGVALQFVTDPVGTAKRLAGVVLAAGLIGGFLWVLRTVELQFSSPTAPDRATPTTTATTTATPGGTGGFGSGSGDPTLLPIDVIVGGALLALAVGAVGLLLWRRGLRSALGRGSADEPSAADETLGAVAEVAGETADRVAAAATPAASDDAIFAAWSEMVALLDADPRSATPRQFETAAIEAGMGPADVRALTRAFEAVRYGDVTLTEERREEAVAACRRIEATHGAAESDGSPADIHRDAHEVPGRRRDVDGLTNADDSPADEEGSG